MLWFLRDYPLAAVLLRAATLAFDALLIGGIFFCVVVLPSLRSHNPWDERVLCLLRVSAIGLLLTQIGFVALDSAMLISTGGLRLASLYTASYFLAGALLVLTCVVFLLSTRYGVPRAPVWTIYVVPLLAAIVWTSHSASRLDHRLPLVTLTALHQLAAAIWIGGMPYLWLVISSQGKPDFNANAEGVAVRTVRRYSTTALVSVAVLVLAGVGMAWVYTQSWSAVYGTAYGVVLLAKSTMLVALLVLGLENFLLIRDGHLHIPAMLLRIARFSELEIGIGFTIILAAASLTSQPPAVDLVPNRVTLPEIAARMTPRWPSFHTPPIAAMPAVEPMHRAIQQYALSPDDPRSANNAVEQAWSEYNHHWAGLVVLLAGLLALLGRSERFRWARHWPLVFLGLAVFLFFRADPEAWPLGPRGFWASFYNPEDLQHRIYVLLILSFVAFEWGVQTRRLLSRRAALVFPFICAAGGALLLTHNHTLGNVKEELLIGMTHIAIAVLAVLAGWSRWLDVRMSASAPNRIRSIAAAVWPVCLIFIGLVLLNYRES